MAAWVESFNSWSTNTMQKLGKNLLEPLVNLDFPILISIARVPFSVLTVLFGTFLCNYKVLFCFFA